MLTKLLKYELMAEWKKYAIILGGILFLGISAFATNAMITPGKTRVGDTIHSLIIMSFTLLCIFALLIVFVFSTMRFYKNMFCDEGYLMNTLPCSAGQHIASKMLATYIWCAATSIIIILSVSIAAGDFTWPSDLIIGITASMNDMREVLPAEMAESFISFMKKGLAYMAVSLILCPLLYQIYLNFCIAVGSLFNTHKILMAVVTFVCVNIVSQVISTIAMFALDFTNSDTFMAMESENLDIASANMIADTITSSMNNLLIFSGIFTVVIYGAMVWATHYIMSKKLNLA